MTDRQRDYPDVWYAEQPKEPKGDWFTRDTCDRFVDD